MWGGLVNIAKNNSLFSAKKEIKEWSAVILQLLAHAKGCGVEGVGVSEPVLVLACVALRKQ